MNDVTNLDLRCSSTGRTRRSGRRAARASGCRSICSRHEAPRPGRRPRPCSHAVQPNRGRRACPTDEDAGSVDEQDRRHGQRRDHQRGQKPGSAHGRMFWFRRNTLSGSHARLSATSRSYLARRTRPDEGLVRRLADVVHVLAGIRYGSMRSMPARPPGDARRRRRRRPIDCAHPERRGPRRERGRLLGHPADRPPKAQIENESSPGGLAACRANSSTDPSGRLRSRNPLFVDPVAPAHRVVVRVLRLEMVWRVDRAHDPGAEGEERREHPVGVRLGPHVGDREHDDRLARDLGGYSSGQGRVMATDAIRSSGAVGR